MRRFQIIQVSMKNGEVAGAEVAAQGVEFGSGQVAVRHLAGNSTFGVYPDADGLEAEYGQRLIWASEDAPNLIPRFTVSHVGKPVLEGVRFKDGTVGYQSLGERGAISHGKDVSFDNAIGSLFEISWIDNAPKEK